MDHDAQWYENEDFWREFKPMLFDESRWTTAAEQVDKIVELVDLKPGARILDLCCGVGRHSLELARRGYFVTGVDRSAQYLDEARSKAKEEGLTVEFEMHDMRDYRKDSTFDLVLNIYTSFGYFDDIEDDRRVLRNIHSSLQVHGKCLIDTIGKEVVARTFTKSNWCRVDDGSIVLQEAEICDNWSKLNNTWTMIKDGNHNEFHFILRCYSAVELSSMFTECGFGDVDCYGNLSGSLYDNDASRLIVVGKK